MGACQQAAVDIDIAFKEKQNNTKLDLSKSIPGFSQKCLSVSGPICFPCSPIRYLDPDTLLLKSNSALNLQVSQSNFRAFQISWEKTCILWINLSILCLYQGILGG